MSIQQLSTSAIRTLFEEETAERRGRVSDTFDDGRRVFLRSILPSIREVRKDDAMQPGVALRANETDLLIHPYLFRQVCTNGAIVAQSLESRHIRIATVPTEEDVAWELRAAIRDCSTEEVFAGSIEQVRSTVDRGADFAIAMMSFLGRMAGSQNDHVVTDIVARFFESGDPTAFGWMNAITSAARDAEDPELRWRLEEEGGAVAAALRGTPVLPSWRAEPMEWNRELAGVA